MRRKNEKDVVSKIQELVTKKIARASDGYQTSNDLPNTGRRTELKED